MKNNLIYFAGLFDAEGCIHLHRQAPGGENRTNKTVRYALLLDLTNTNKEIIEEFYNFVGAGCIQTRKRNKIVYSWRASSQDAELILRELLPYLVVKRQESFIALEFLALPKVKNCSLGIPIELQKQRELLANKLKQIKRQNIPVDCSPFLALSKEDQAIWLAGLFDGEGHISIRKRIGKRIDGYWLIANLDITNESAIMCAGMFVNACHLVKNTGIPNGGTKDGWRISLSRNQAHEFLTNLQPYSRIKRKEVDIVLRLKDSNRPIDRENLRIQLLTSRQ